ncbi:DUF2710 domain-containing protein [Mycobacterium sp. MYCO198283]|uniref:DUF2710 domain-containing protein n=1 Tax=Mycobacterium sp. MYCO198283 TaxID=2883505 RepID=UPI001E61A950|nr:DUF2710 domain-containing protein [Mycobacterium sp. MYCO198283]MCG5433041.1 DUF2710 domain-containing protein [Mycobacterium sp. MYCO198283]
MTAFDELDDADKVRYSQAELAQTHARLNELLDRLARLRTEAVDPDGDVELTLGSDGRLIALSLHPSVTSRLTNEGLENKIARLLADANEVAGESWRDAY